MVNKWAAHLWLFRLLVHKYCPLAEPCLLCNGEESSALLKAWLSYLVLFSRRCTCSFTSCHKFWTLLIVAVKHYVNITFIKQFHGIIDVRIHKVLHIAIYWPVYWPIYYPEYYTSVYDYHLRLTSSC